MTSQKSSLESRFPRRATRWKLRTRTLDLAARPLLMGIVNVTPDSFSEGGKFFGPTAAIDQALRLEADGAAILDVGGESTRPNSDRVSADDELRRVMPVVAELCQRAQVPISIDTSKAEVAREALDAGCQIINDVTGLEGDPRMVGVAVDSGAGVCAMHMRGTPQTMQDDPTYGNVVEEIHDYLRRRRDLLLLEGIEAERICLDPGIGFGKTHQHNLTLLTGCDQFHDLACPLLVGPSRKGFIAKILGDSERDRTAGTIGVALALARRGVQILRVHDVRPVDDALRLYEAVGGIDGAVAELL